MKTLILTLIMIGSTAWAGSDPAVAAGCAELNKIGNFSALKHEIALDMAEINRLVKGPSDDKMDTRLTGLTDQIRRDTEAMEQLAGDQYTQVIYQQQLDYVLNLQQLEDGPTLNPLESIKSAWLTELYNFSGRVSEPLSRAKLSFDANHVLVRVTRPASLLEICQLPDTLMIGVAMNVQSLFSVETVKRNIFTGENI